MSVMSSSAKITDDPIRAPPGAREKGRLGGGGQVESVSQQKTKDGFEGLQSHG
jgi:hypothetical protein